MAAISIFQVLPQHVFSKEIVRHLEDKDTHRLSQASTVGLAIVKGAIRYHQEDKTLDGERTTINLIESADGTITALLLQK